LLAHSDIGLVNLLGVSVGSSQSKSVALRCPELKYVLLGELEAIMSIITTKLAPEPKTALEMLKAKSAPLCLCKTPSITFDAGMVTEVVGSPGWCFFYLAVP
jgi:hypothetical protein